MPSQDSSLITWLLRACDVRDQPPEAEEPNASPAAPARKVVLPGLQDWITRWEYSKIEEDVQTCWAVSMNKLQHCVNPWTAKSLQRRRTLLI